MKCISSSKCKALSFLFFSIVNSFGAETAQQAPALGLAPTGITPISFCVYENCNDTQYICGSIDVPYHVVTSSDGLNLLNTFSSSLNLQKPAQEEINKVLDEQIKKQGSVSLIFSHDVEKIITEYVHTTNSKYQALLSIEFGPYGTSLKPNGRNYAIDPSDIQENPRRIRAYFEVERPSQSEGLSSKIYKIVSLRWILQAIYAIRERLY